LIHTKFNNEKVLKVILDRTYEKNYYNCVLENNFIKIEFKKENIFLKIRDMINFELNKEPLKIYAKKNYIYLNNIELNSKKDNDILSFIKKIDLELLAQDLLSKSIIKNPGINERVLIVGNYIIK
jgi:hypothetical protein